MFLCQFIMINRRQDTFLTRTFILGAFDFIHKFQSRFKLKPTQNLKYLSPIPSPQLDKRISAYWNEFREMERQERERVEASYKTKIYKRLELGFNGLSRIIHIDYYSIEGDFLLFPNPTSNKVNLIRSNPSRQQLKIKVFTFQGEHMFDMQTPRETVQIDVSTWPSGTYLITIHNQDALMEKVQYANFIVTNN